MWSLPHWFACCVLTLQAVAAAGCHSCHHAGCRQALVAAPPSQPTYAPVAASSQMQYGPAITGESLGARDDSAVKRYLEIKERLIDLEKTNTGLKEELNQVRFEIDANEKAFSKATEEMRLAASDVADVRRQLATWERTTEALYARISQSRENELNDLEYLESRLTALVTEHARRGSPPTSMDSQSRQQTSQQPVLAPIIDAHSGEPVGIGASE